MKLRRQPVNGSGIERPIAAHELKEVRQRDRSRSREVDRVHPSGDNGAAELSAHALLLERPGAALAPGEELGQLGLGPLLFMAFDLFGRRRPASASDFARHGFLRFGDFVSGDRDYRDAVVEQFVDGDDVPAIVSAAERGEPSAPTDTSPAYARNEHSSAFAAVGLWRGELK